ncbi:5' nucleotidase family-domain-containing protein [Absidia repens]|uniref:5' nucleotidase family-domain-containing protein n=1 Tax=Absidia repens TaxID=90262 RepID=A0A1X2IC41_9FUNG|nr:5' nucleotidase family-domain-containing protein [Absidia repens]
MMLRSISCSRAHTAPYVLLSHRYRRYHYQHSLSYTEPLENALAHFTQKYQEKKLKHINAAKLDNATILPMTNDPISKIIQEKTRNQASQYSHSELPDSIYGLAATSPEDVFVNNELDLGQVEVYGFDYDYTLANYSHELSKSIYDIIKEILVDMLRYPKQIKDFQYDPNFAIRGLHYDYNNGWLMKIDNMSNIQLNTVYVGREPISNRNEVIDLHRGLHIAPNYLHNNMFQLNDLFSTPQACILCDVLQYFRENNISFHPRYLCDDVSQAARVVHTGSHLMGMGGRIHSAINKDISRFLDPAPKLVEYLENLRKGGKKTFLMTNSTLPFIDIGMKYLTSSPNWRDLFDCVIVSARKPDFYLSRRPFRRTREPTWDAVTKFEPGEVYQGGNLSDFSRLTGWSGQRVLYFGDHVYSDLVDPTMQQGWRTGAIIHELAEEIDIRNTPSYRHTLSWLLRLEQLLKEAQSYDACKRPEGLDGMIEAWRAERAAARLELKIVFNRHFGSVFRTNNNPTFFANKIRKFADIYTSSISNLNAVPQDYVFYPNRIYLPHERVVETLIDGGNLGHPF